jgi:TonB family protein
MPVNYTPGRSNFGMLPEPERSTASFVTSIVINGLILALILYIGATARKIITEHKYEMTELIVPTPPPPEKVKLPEPPKIKPPDMPVIKLEPPKIVVPRQEPKPEPKPIQMEAKVTLPVMKADMPKVIEAPQPKSALAPAAMPAQDNSQKPSTKPVHFGQTFGVTPNPNATRPATVAAIGNPYGGNKGPAIAPHGIPGSTGIGDGVKFGNNGGRPGGRVGSAGIPTGTVGGTGNGYSGAKVGSAGIPTVAAAAPVQQVVEKPISTSVEVLSKTSPEYTPEAKRLKIEGDVVLRVTFTAGGQVVVQSVVRGLGHGLDEEARRVAQQIRFRPATRNGQAVDSTTTITITFQLA